MQTNDELRQNGDVDNLSALDSDHPTIDGCGLVDTVEFAWRVDCFEAGASLTLD